MSAIPVSPHIPDINLITYYAERQESFLSRVSPWTKLSLLVVIILTVTILRNPFVLLGLYMVVLALVVLAHLPLMKLFRWCLFPVLFVLSLVGILAWTQPGTPLISLSGAGIPLTLTDQGLLLVVILLLKALISVTYSLLFLMTTRYEHLSGVISRVFPAPVDQIFLMAYRFFFLTLEMMGAVLKAFRSRGGGLVRGITKQGALFAGIIGLVFVRSFDRAERVEKAMVARGYHGSYSSNARIPIPGAAEFGAIGLFIAAIAVASLVIPSGGW
ncbi:MAG: cobalt ECF transporter T component CbiQ [Methanomicrobiales archaeon]|nr:cobalt ECF transporter T component CbiQ [Methanomicrobiales archaeon]